MAKLLRERKINVEKLAKSIWNELSKYWNYEIDTWENFLALVKRVVLNDNYTTRKEVTSYILSWYSVD